MFLRAYLINMREKPSQIAFLLLFGALLAPSASARPANPAHVLAHRAAHAVEPSRRSAHVHSTRTHASQQQHPATRHVLGLKTVQSRTDPPHMGTHLAATRPVEQHPVFKSRVAGQPAPLVQSHVDARIDPLLPNPAAAELPPIEVRHNRKLHLDPDTSAPAPEASLDAWAAPDTSAAPPSLHPVSVVERALPALPVARAAPVLVPDPVIEPLLYTARGHLIVPPAMKGSHEILLHQNEMADEDGLIRVQDDDDLNRLRASKQFVALPVSAALEVDERLPANRRYCRPWTAQFLAAMAQSHYTRFHTPLQVNSAVRTVAFQERLRYTNGNAAPAEGETASPHLTGQAIDLAKRGLSMTEIAWMRGYLMPLVQQGKIDVEEEFQQSCFHISVYRKYLPQPAPKREIPARRSPATAIAAAIQ